MARPYALRARFTLNLSTIMRYQNQLRRDQYHIVLLQNAGNGR